MPIDREQGRDDLSVIKKPKENISIYAAAGIGAFFLGLSDLMKHEPHSIVEKMANILQRATFIPNTQEPPVMIALLLLVILGVLACWVHRPTERIQGFLTGFSVFALLTVGVPKSEIEAAQTPTTSAGGTTELSTNLAIPPSSSFSFSFFISSALADDHLSAYQMSSKKIAPKGSVTIILKDSQGQRLSNTNTFIVTIVNRKDNERKRYRFSEAQFSIAENFNNYKLFIEIEGYRNTYTHFAIDKTQQVAYILTLESSAVPIGLQKLMSPVKKELAYSDFETGRLRGIRLFEIGEYERAIQYYDKVLQIKPNHAEIINFKGYAFFRWGKYQEAENVLSNGIIKYPDNLLIRLNLAKNYCKFGKNTAAENILFKQFSLSKQQKQLICNDQELMNVCPILIQPCSIN